jgi:transposase
MENTAQLATMNAAELRALAAKLMTEIADTKRDNRLKQLKIDQLTHEMAVLKRLKFAARSEKVSALQRSLFEESIEADLEAIALELKALQTKETRQVAKGHPKRKPLPEHLPRTEVRHEPEATTCSCGCALQRIGEEVSEKLDYSPGVFRVERHIRGKWVCRTCETVQQAPMPPTLIDKGIPTPRLLAHVLISKYLDHLPLYRLSGIYGREGVPIPESTLAEWVGLCGFDLQPLVDALREILLTRPVLHADETPVAMLDPGNGKTHRAYLWGYATTAYDPIKAVIFEFCEGRAGKHPKRFLEGWSGQLVCDHYAGYTALFKGSIIEVGCLAHARRKFHALTTKQPHPIADEALQFFQAIYTVEASARALDDAERKRLRQLHTKPILTRFHEWLALQRQRATDGTALANAIDYSLRRWAALTRFIDDGRLPPDNNHLENRIRPISLGRKNWLFAGSLRAGQRAAAIMTLIQSAKLNGIDPFAYLADVLARIPTHPNRRIEELLPHNWKPRSDNH